MGITEVITKDETKVIRLVTKEYICSDGTVKNSLDAAQYYERWLEFQETWKDYTSESIGPVLNSNGFGQDMIWGFKATELIDALKILVDKYGPDLYIESSLDTSETRISYKKDDTNVR